MSILSHSLKRCGAELAQLSIDFFGGRRPKTEARIEQWCHDIAIERLEKSVSRAISRPQALQSHFAQDQRIYVPRYREFSDAERATLQRSAAPLIERCRQHGLDLHIDINDGGHLLIKLPGWVAPRFKLTASIPM